MKAIIFTLTFVLLVGGVGFYFFLQQQSSDKSPASAAQSGASQKKGDTILTGTLVKSGAAFFIKTTDGKNQELESYAVDLNEYVGQQIKVTGQYSGDTLFVGKIE